MYEELVKRLRERAQRENDYFEHGGDIIKDAADAIENLSKERNTGKWIFPTDIIGFGRCSECKALWDYSLITNKFFKVCPRCGSYNSYNGGDDDGA